MSTQKWANTDSNIGTHMVFNDQLTSMSQLICRPRSGMHKPIWEHPRVPSIWAAAQIDNLVKAFVSNGRVCQQHMSCRQLL
jgi:hypothetical protein